jgi:hypothetical protein
MFKIKFINNLVFKDDKLCAEGRMGHPTAVFLRQGQLDGACGVYCLLMLLILHKRINREDLTTEICRDDPPYVMRLKKELLNPLQGIISDGTTIGYLRDMLLKVFENHIPVNIMGSYNKEKVTDAKNLHSKIKNHLDAGFPVLICYSKPNASGHAVVSIGYTICGDSLRLYCLDPSFPIPWSSFWNNIIDVNMNYENEDWSDYNHRVESKVHVYGILVIEDNIKEENNMSDYEYILKKVKQFHYKEWEYDELMKCVDMLPNLSRQELVSLYTSKWIKNEITLKWEILTALFGEEVTDPWLHFDEMSTDELIRKYEQRGHKFIVVFREELRLRYKADMGDDRIKIAAAFQNGTKGDQKWLEKQLRKLRSNNDPDLPF